MAVEEFKQRLEAARLSFEGTPRDEANEEARNALLGGNPNKTLSLNQIRTTEQEAGVMRLNAIIQYTY